MKVRIGLISGEYPPMQGGVGDFTRELAQAMAAGGQEIHILTGSGQTGPTLNPTTATASARPGPTLKRRADTAKPAEAGCMEGDLPSLDPYNDEHFSVHRCIGSWDWGCWKHLRDLAAKLELSVLNMQYQAAAYQLHPAINFLPAGRKWLGLPPIVTTFHDLNVPYLFPKAGALRKWTIHELARRSDGVIVTNYEDRAALSALRTSQGRRSIRCLKQIPIGSNIAPTPPADYRREAWRAERGIQPEENLIAYFGFLHPLKGGEVLIRALARLVSQGVRAKIVFIGGQTGSSDPHTNTAYATRVEALADELGLADRIMFTGYVTPQQVTAAFYASDMTALPYLEGASLRHGTLMAALAHGRAIVTTRSSQPSPELRDGNNVVLIAPGDDAALAGGLKRLIDEPARRAQLEQGATDLAQAFRWETIAARTLELYQQVLDNESK